MKSNSILVLVILFAIHLDKFIHQIIFPLDYFCNIALFLKELCIFNHSEFCIIFTKLLQILDTVRNKKMQITGL